MRLSELRGRRVAILGAGREGLSAARLLAERRDLASLVLVADQEVGDEVKRELEDQPGLALRIEAGAFERLEDVDVAIRSPGLGWYRADLAKARAQGVVMTSLTDLFLAEREGGHVVAVTGTKGKSTTTSLLALGLEGCGVRACAAGNIGTPVFDADPEGRADVIVLEVSSYQACGLEHGPEHAVLTSLYPEHLDWHGGLERYYEDKLGLLRLARGLALVNGANEEAERRTRSLPRRRLFQTSDGVHVVEDELRSGARVLGDARQVPLEGAHNRSNLCAALAAVEALGHDARDALAALADFAGLPHRLHPVAEVEGILFVDDSLSTIPQATLEALDAFRGRPVALIVGGRDRGVDLTPLREALDREPVVRVALLGETGRRLAEGVDPERADRIAAVPDMESAVRFCRRDLPVGGVVLLSPAAATDDAFRDAMERGRAFANAAQPAD